MNAGGVARVVLGASGIVAAFVALLPAAIAMLIALFDVSAHGLLGMSGTLVGLAAPFGGGRGALATYRGVEIDLPRAASLSFLRGLPPIGMIVFAIAGNGARPRTRWTWATACSGLACATAGWPAAPGCLAGVSLLVRA